MAVSDPFVPGLVRRLAAPPRTVVVFRASRIGDFVCATPAFRALRAALPGTRISLIGLPHAAELVARCPHLDELICFPGFPGIADQWFDARRTTAFFAEMQARHFDLALQMHGSGVFSNPATLMLGARHTAGFIRAGDSPGRLDAAMVFPGQRHAVLALLSLLEFLGIPPRGEHTEFRLNAADQAVAARLLEGAPPPLIGVHPGARDPRKMWPLERFAEAVAAIRRGSGGTVVILGGPEPLDRAACARLAERCGAPRLNLAGQVTLAQTGAIIERLHVLLTNDSGPAHMAYALGTRAVTIFGFTDPAEWGPLERSRHRVVVPAAGVDVNNPGRLLSIPVEQVTGAVREILRAA